MEKFLYFCIISLLFFACNKESGIVVVPEPVTKQQKFTVETIVSGNGIINVLPSNEVVVGAKVSFDLKPDFGYLYPKSLIVNDLNVLVNESVVINSKTQVKVVFELSKDFLFLTSKVRTCDSTYINGVGSKSKILFNLSFKTNKKVVVTVDGFETEYNWDFDEILKSITFGGGNYIYNIDIKNQRFYLNRNGIIDVYK